jgi:hypothetical protein
LLQYGAQHDRRVQLFVVKQHRNLEAQIAVRRDHNLRLKAGVALRRRAVRGGRAAGRARGSRYGPSGKRAGLVERDAEAPVTCPLVTAARVPRVLFLRLLAKPQGTATS